MKFNRFGYQRILGVVLVLVALTVPSTVFAHDAESDNRVYPPERVVYGMTSGDWGAALWQWITSIPLSKNPAVTGTNCLIGQEHGPVFLAPASLGGSVTMSCSVPATKAIFITVLTDECSSVEPAPFHGSNAPELRNCSGAGADTLDPNTLELSVDGRPVENLKRFRVQTPAFRFTMPAADNLFGMSGVTSGLSLLDGYFVMLRPLSKGQHVIQFGGAFTSGPASGFAAHTTLNLKVE